MRRPDPARRTRETHAQRRERRASVADVAEVLDAAARFLEARSRSVAEVRRRLATAGYGPGPVEDAITRLVQQGYLDDDAFARAWVESRDRARPRGERALRTELIQKGIARETIDAVLAERDAGRGTGGSRGTRASSSERDGGSVEEPGLSADEVAARRLIERNRRALLREDDPRKRRQRGYALLARSGFDPETSRTVAASVADVEDADESEMPAAEGP